MSPGWHLKTPEDTDRAQLNYRTNIYTLNHPWGFVHFSISAGSGGLCRSSLPWPNRLHAVSNPASHIKQRPRERGPCH